MDYLKHLTAARCVDDLEWALTSPSLLRGPAGVVLTDAEFDALCPSAQRVIRQLRAEPAPLWSFVRARLRGNRLGKYFECLLAYALLQEPALGPVVANHVVSERKGTSGPTLGECDFLVRDNARGRTLHLEVALKFYLKLLPAPGSDGEAHGTSTGAADALAAHPSLRAFVGPGGRDRLSRKLDKLFHQQLVLIRDDPERLPPSLAGLPGPVEPRALVKGMLFYPWREFLASPIAAPAVVPAGGLSESHLKGWWCAASEADVFARALAESPAWCLLERPYPLAGVALSSAARADLSTAGLLPSTPREIIEASRSAFAAHDTHTCFVAALDARTLRETSRGFFVDDAWLADLRERESSSSRASS